jgi:uncharacterized protein (DUF433 family)
MATMTFEPMNVPLREDDHGAIRVGDTRVLLDLVIQEFRNGATPEEIVESYGAMDLADVYAVISYYLRHPDMIDAYLHRREQEAKAVREMIEGAQPPRPNLRATIMARAKAREKADVQAD